MVRLQVQNIKNVEAALKKYGVEAVKDIGEVVKIKALTMVDTAQSLVPRNKSTLALSIKQQEITPLSYNVGTNEPYAPFMEFGTGAKVKVPVEFKSMADLARGRSKGSFKEGLESIKRWCKDKGIDIKLAYIIFVNILNNGIEAKPFMYPAFLEARRTFSKDIKQVIKELNKKFNNG